MERRMETFTHESRFGVTTTHELLAQPQASDRLLVLLPGRGYTTDYPLFYYLRKAAFRLGWDVLSVQYGFQAARADLQAQDTPALVEETSQIVLPVIRRGYARVCLAGKSLGTPLAAEIARQVQGAAVRLLMLTPIGGALHGLDGFPTLALIGAADPIYAAEEVAAFAHHPTIRWRVFDKLNHSLEVSGDWHGSLAVLPEIIGVCASFLAAE